MAKKSNSFESKLKKSHKEFRRVTTSLLTFCLSKPKTEWTPKDKDTFDKKMDQFGEAIMKVTAYTAMTMVKKAQLNALKKLEEEITNGTEGRS